MVTIHLKDKTYVNGGRGYGKTQYEKLQHNWNELEKWLSAREFRYGIRINIQEVLNKMQEIEEKRDNE